MCLELRRTLGPLRRISAVLPAERCARPSCLRGQPRPRAAGLERGRGTLRHVFTHLRSLSSAASQVSGHGRCREQRRPVREGRGGGEPPPDPFPSPFPPLRQWFPREREGRAKTGARTRIRSFTAVLARIPPGVFREAGQGLGDSQAVNVGVASSSFPSILSVPAPCCFGRPSQSRPRLTAPDGNRSSKPD